MMSNLIDLQDLLIPEMTIQELEEAIETAGNISRELWDAHMDNLEGEE